MGGGRTSDEHLQRGQQLGVRTSRPAPEQHAEGSYARAELEAHLEAIKRGSRQSSPVYLF